MFFHKVMIARAKSETVPFGSISLYDWFAFFSSYIGNSALELRLIAGFVRASGGEPFSLRKADFSQLDDIKCFYNVCSIVESLLNICEIRCGLRHDDYK